MVNVRFIKSGVQYGYGYNFNEIAAMPIAEAERLQALKVVQILRELESPKYETPETAKKYERRKK